MTRATLLTILTTIAMFAVPATGALTNYNRR
jgi:hypothetical protein